MKRLIAICAAVLLILNVPLLSQEVTKVGTTAAGFLNHSTRGWEETCRPEKGAGLD